ncbi:cell wall-binding repeat-containing protein [Desulfitobacterium metallireducens]|uniref:Cell wall-binding protein n=1 Tax=Desulfitobacterium metallireducens DSM 15288 TaxID=871968 RepID=W0EB76_9FIRM|nr:cell wall-binding repeat-containing protein [Desulfitobacterium metallireducens]AHF08017.1 cell wall-binding protein [Desulfitobacterium metallireducens DSM 15288]
MKPTFTKKVAPILAVTLLLGSIWVSPALAEENSIANTLTSLSQLKMSELPKDPAERLGGVDRYETAAQIAEAGWADNSSDYAVLSAGMDENLVDALTAAPLAHLRKAPILLTEGDTLNSYTEKELKRLGVKTVYVTSGSGVIKSSVLDTLENGLGLKVVPLGGQDRFETSLNIAKELGSFDQVIVSTAYNNADALSVAAIAASQGIPIFLSEADQLPQSVKEYLKTKQIKQSYVLGGEGALSSVVEQALTNPKRLGGSDRFGTNVKIIEAFAGVIQGKKLYLASGNDNNLVDALAGSSLASQTSSAIFLIDNQTLPAGTRDFIKTNFFPIVPADLVALGGKPVVPDQVLEDMSSMALYAQDGAMVGSAQANLPEILNDNGVVTGNNVTVNGLSTPYNLYIEGNNVTLKNVTVQGGIIINPGAQGEIRMDNVKAKSILVLSGGPDGIQIANSEIATLIVESTSQVGVTVTTGTTIENTVASAQATLDASGGSFGKVVISKLAQTEPNIELQGTFDDQGVAVVEGVVTNTSPNRIPVLYVVSLNPEQKVELKGNYDQIVVVTPSNVTFNEGSAIKMIANKDANLTVDSSIVLEGITRQ